jgi:surface polysaccharide O-acyltransferase-like enzyme
MGCKIGKRTIITGPMQCFDWNAVSFGSDCYVDGFLQLHTFEDMILKVKKTTVEDGCAINPGATIMGGAVIERNSTLLPLSLVLKEMNLPTAAYQGSPAETVNDPEAALAPPKAVEASTVAAPLVDKTDWLKTAAIIMVMVDHIGYFFIADDAWWSVFGRMAAPVFFFLIGYAHTRKAPIQWILLGIILTLLDSSNNDWTWVAPNILLSFACIRLVRPYAQGLVQRHGLLAYAIFAAILVAALPVAAKVFDYGTEGWLWALLGLAQRTRADAKSSDDPANRSAYKNLLLSVLVCIAAAGVYIWQEQKEFDFDDIQLITFVLCTWFLSLTLCLFARGPSRVQPKGAFNRTLLFIGRHTLAIYALELAVFEIVIKVFPDLGP